MKLFLKSFLYTGFNCNQILILYKTYPLSFVIITDVKRMFKNLSITCTIYKFRYQQNKTKLDCNNRVTMRITKNIFF